MTCLSAGPSSVLVLRAASNPGLSIVCAHLIAFMLHSTCPGLMDLVSVMSIFSHVNYRPIFSSVSVKFQLVNCCDFVI